MAEGRLASLTELQYDEKLAVIADNIEFIQTIGPGGRIPSFDRLRYDVIAISHLKGWASPRKKSELTSKLNDLEKASGNLTKQDQDRAVALVDDLLRWLG